MNIIKLLALILCISTCSFLAPLTSVSYAVTYDATFFKDVNASQSASSSGGTTVNNASTWYNLSYESLVNKRRIREMNFDDEFRKYYGNNVNTLKNKIRDNINKLDALSNNVSAPQLVVEFMIVEHLCRKYNNCALIEEFGSYVPSDAALEKFKIFLVMPEQPTEPQGSGANVFAEAALSRGDAKQILPIVASIPPKPATNPNPGVPECAWKDAHFQQTYLAFASGKLSSTAAMGGSSTISQDAHRFVIGGDGSVYKRQDISIAGDNDNTGSCDWVDSQNAAMSGSQKHIYVDKYVVVFPEDYHYYEGEFQCSQPLVFFVVIK